MINRLLDSGLCNWINSLNLLISTDVVLTVGQQKCSRTLNKEIQLSSLISIDTCHFFFEGSTWVDSFDSWSHSKAFIVVSHAIGHLEEGTLGLIAEVLSFLDLSIFLKEARTSQCVHNDSEIHDFAGVTGHNFSGDDIGDMIFYIDLIDG